MVLDTNQYISSLITPNGNSYRIIREWREKRIQVLISPSILLEIERVFSYSKIKEHYKIFDKDIQDLLVLLQTDAIRTLDSLEINTVTADPTDNKFIACAIEGNADFIVTGDKHLLDIGSYQNIRILTPRMFLDEIKFKD